jgi:diaminohydroxyphosphoribosylaminopyrimidine deaminase/5-amino-6-(5-phosphoribosylamino)uracil reductase
MGNEAFDRHMMAIAVAMAERGLGRAAPNPSVGAVVADPATGEVIARGWTQPGGRPHAETEALRRAGGRAKGATLYVTLEPCAHHGVTPPCADAIVAAGVSRVVAGIEDPDTRTRRLGFARLSAAGIDVETGVCSEDARWVTLGHILRVTERRPFVQVKIAVGPDAGVPRGEGGQPRWATGEPARAMGHMLRAHADAILVGVGTVLDDDPELTCRVPGLAERSPACVVVDTRLRTPAGARVLAHGGENARVWIATAASATSPEAVALAGSGATILGDLGSKVGGDGASRVDLVHLLGVLADNGVTRLLVEGGPEIWRSFAAEDLADEATVFHAGHATDGGLALVLKQLLPGAAMRLADMRGIGDDTMGVFRRA